MTSKFKPAIDRKFRTVVADDLIYKAPLGAKFTGYRNATYAFPSITNGTTYTFDIDPKDKVGNYFIEETELVVAINVVVPAGYTAGTFNLRKYFTGFCGTRADPINRATNLLTLSINGTMFTHCPTNITNALMALNYGSYISDVESLGPVQTDETSNYGYLNAYKYGSGVGLPFDNGDDLQNTIDQTINNPFGNIQDKTFGNVPRIVASADFVFVTDQTGQTVADDQNPEIAYDAGDGNVYYLKYSFRTPFFLPMCAYYAYQEKVWSNIYQLNFKRTFSQNAVDLMFNFNSVPPTTLSVAGAGDVAGAIVIRKAGQGVTFIQPSTIYLNSYTLPESLVQNPITQISWYKYSQLSSVPILFDPSVDLTTPLVGISPSILVEPSPTVQVSLPVLKLGYIPKTLYIWGQRVDDSQKSFNDCDALGLYFTNISIDINTQQGIFSQMSERQIFDEFTAKKAFNKSFTETRYITAPFNIEGTNVTAGAWAVGDNAYCNMPLYGQVLRIDADQLPFNWECETAGMLKQIQLSIQVTVGSCDNSFIGITDNSQWGGSSTCQSRIYCYIEEESFLIINKDTSVVQMSAPIDAQIVKKISSDEPTTISYLHPMLQGGSFWGDLVSGAKKLGKLAYDNREAIGKVGKQVYDNRDTIKKHAKSILGKGKQYCVSSDEDEPIYRGGRLLTDGEMRSKRY